MMRKRERPLKKITMINRVDRDETLHFGTYHKQHSNMMDDDGAKKKKRKEEED